MRWGLAAALAVALAQAAPEPAAAAGSIVIDNRSGRAVKAVAKGGRAVVEPDTGPTPMTVESDAETGIDLKIWWTAAPRELCQLFVPWERTVIVTGSTTIRCRSE